MREADTSSKPTSLSLRGLLFQQAENGVAVRIKWNKEERAELSKFPLKWIWEHIAFLGEDIRRSQ